MREMDFGVPQAIGPEFVDAARFVMGNGGLVNEAGGYNAPLVVVMITAFTLAGVAGARAFMVGRSERRENAGDSERKTKYVKR